MRDCERHVQRCLGSHHAQDRIRDRLHRLAQSVVGGVRPADDACRQTGVRFDDARQIAQVEIGIGLQFHNATRRFGQRRNRQRLIEALSDAQFRKRRDAGNDRVMIVGWSRGRRLGADVDAEVEHRGAGRATIELGVAQRHIFVGLLCRKREAFPFVQRAGRRRAGAS